MTKTLTVKADARLGDDPDVIAAQQRVEGLRHDIEAVPPLAWGSTESRAQREHRERQADLRDAVLVAERDLAAAVAAQRGRFLEARRAKRLELLDEALRLGEALFAAVRAREVYDQETAHALGFVEPVSLLRQTLGKELARMKREVDGPVPDPGPPPVATGRLRVRALVRLSDVTGAAWNQFIMPGDVEDMYEDDARALIAKGWAEAVVA